MKFIAFAPWCLTTDPTRAPELPSPPQRCPLTVGPQPHTMSTILRTLRNLRRIGIKEYGHQMQYIGDTKAGTLIGTDKFGNKYFENLEEELPLRTRWVDYKEKEYDPSQIEPGWHAWISYMVDKPPNADPINRQGVRAWEPKEHKPVLSLSRSAYKPYSTTKNKYSAWQPVAKARA
ncbi:uncharacterized protein PV09_00372 [Verruconis gallopava]|uniref:NADH dehydrogenase [ubiquinone] 1 alpha subcomplex subunit n=1 Tax=Verruconis gallopava TaxID=253628 RepID=A0A0D2ASN7_9PEZI|nr:uncharacterized protein PV09_00372 [Verruconis gallopava]KIW09495.1 hypothetical protein PV09_00372 [Verruconis gallopava]